MEKKPREIILEVAILDIQPNRAEQFEQAFTEASKIIASMGGYISHQLQRCLEKKDRYLLLVNWETLEDHEKGFRQSEDYQRWKEMLHHFYDPFPVVEHYTRVI